MISSTTKCPFIHYTQSGLRKTGYLFDILGYSQSFFLFYRDNKPMFSTMFSTIIFTSVFGCTGAKQTNMAEVLYTFPEESSPHEGTWLQWSQHHQYGIAFRNDLDSTWVAMTKELI